MKYKAFISYRHTENGRRHAVALETALKRYAKPTLSRPMKIGMTKKGGSVTLDPHPLPPAPARSPAAPA